MRKPLLFFILILVGAGLACGTTTVSVETDAGLDDLPTLVPTAAQPELPEEDTGSPRVDSNGLPPTYTPAPTVPVPTLFPVTTPTATIDPGSLDVYVVVRGDTLREIAESYGVTVEELAALNGIENIDVIEVGQQLLIPPR